MQKLFLIIFLILLSGCSIESMYGINSDEWNKLDDKQKKQVITGYFKIQKEKYSEKSNEIDSKAPKLNLAIYGGWIKMPPFTKYFRYKIVKTTLASGECRKIDVLQPQGDNHVSLSMCYRDKKLEIDSSSYVFDKRHGSIVLRRSPVWSRGYTYKHVNSTGYARLKNVHLRVQLMS